MLTKDTALSLRYRDELLHAHEKNSDGTPVRCRVNGACVTWKTRPFEFKLPVKHGLRQCFYITERNAEQWTPTRLAVTSPEQQAPISAVPKGLA